MTTTTVLDSEDMRLLEKTIRIRERIVDELTKGSLPSDDGDRKFLIDGLAGIDRAILSKAKVKNEEKANKNSESAAAIMAKLLLQTSRNTGMTSHSSPPVLPADISCGELVDGQTQIGTINVSQSEIFE